ncbi:MAG TPA: hypothetical protein VEG39_04845 [Clostridia bacterium]|nr:hypothetical protein [Clostridia bacterium]
MKKTLLCLLLSLTLVISTTTAVFAANKISPKNVRKSPIIVKPLVDDMGG